LKELPEDPRHPDSTFVEDTAILVSGLAILTRPGAPSRAGEVEGVRDVLAQTHGEIREIAAPGTLDGGDVCEAESHFLIRVTQRTNEAGARQLASILAERGYTSEIIDVRGIEGILHLKSGIAYLGDGRVVAIEALARHPALRSYEVIPVDRAEEYAANCVRVNDRILFAAGHPKLERTIRRLGYDLIPLEMSEFQKMDGGLSCLSLRY
jgi:dimethylargininase